MLIHRISHLVAIALLAAAAVAPLPSPSVAETAATTKPAGLSDADVTAIKAMFKASTDALVEGDLDKWAKYWTKDAVLMPPGHESGTGREQLVKYVQGNLSNLAKFTQANWSFEGRGDLGVVTTDLLWQFKSGAGSEKPLKGKQLVVVKKGADGSWKAQKVIYNTDSGS